MLDTRLPAPHPRTAMRPELPPLPRMPRPRAAQPPSPQVTTSRRPARNYYIDLLRGFAALNIVFIHTTFNSGWDYVPDWVRAASLAVDVPFFFFLSGWAVASMTTISYQKTFASLWRIYSQWVLFVVVTFALMALLAFLTTVPLGSRREFVASFLGNVTLHNPNAALPLAGVMGGGWFLVVYFSVTPVMTTVIALIKRHTESLRPVAVLAFVCLVGFMRLDAGASFFFFDRYFLCYSFFFLLGYLQRDLVLRPQHVIGLIGLSLGGLWLTLQMRNVEFLDVEHLKIALVDMQHLKFAPTLPWACFSMLAILMAMSLKRWQFRVSPRGPLVWVGKNALPFFFMNAVAASMVLFLAPLIALPWVLKLAVCFGVTLAITSVLVISFNQLHAGTTYLAGRLRSSLLSSLAESRGPAND